MERATEKRDLLYGRQSGTMQIICKACAGRTGHSGCCLQCLCSKRHVVGRDRGAAVRRAAGRLSPKDLSVFRKLVARFGGIRGGHWPANDKCMRLVHVAIFVASVVVVALFVLRASGAIPWAPLALPRPANSPSVRTLRQLPGLESPPTGSGPCSPPPPPSSLSRAVADRVAASIAAEAAADLIADFNTTCHPTPAAGFGGGAITWGMTFKTESALECCSACQAHQRICSSPESLHTIFHTRRFRGDSVSARCAPVQGDPKERIRPCNIWLFCPEPRCWSRDRWNHTFGECCTALRLGSSEPPVGAGAAHNLFSAAWSLACGRAQAPAGPDAAASGCVWSVPR